MGKLGLLLLIFILGLPGCITIKPKDFTYVYKAEYTGLDSLININGYYITQRECDSTFFSIFMFYPDGLFTVATAGDTTGLAGCFANGGNTEFCQYPSWGTYRIESNIIKTQTIRQEGMGICTIFRDYHIGANKSLINTSDYVHPENTNLGYMVNYPSFLVNKCPKIATFHPLEKKRNIKDCPYLTKKWFVENR